MEPPEKKKSSSPPPPYPSLSSLPEEIIVNCLARIPRSYYPRLSLVSRSFRSILSSKELYTARSLLGSTEQCLYLSITDGRYQFFEWYTLWNKPNPTSPDLNMKSLVQTPSSNFPSLSYPTVAGSEIYVIGGVVYDQPSSTVRVLDCRTHAWYDAPSMNIARKMASTCVYGGKIYVIGGVKVHESPFAEVFDIEAQTWECLPDPSVEVRSLSNFKCSGFEGKIYYGNPYSMSAFAYDPKQCKWECCENKTSMLWRSMCGIENVFYNFFARRGPEKLAWYDIRDGQWKWVKGLDSLDDKIMMGDHGCNSRLMSVGEKLLAIWYEYIIPTTPSDRNMKIWCAEIVVEKRDNGEIWGAVEWVDVVHTIPLSCFILHSLAISL